MTRNLTYAVPALFALLAVSCQEPAAPISAQAQEVVLVQDIDTSWGTKGVVTGTSLYDDKSGDRSLFLTARLHPQHGNDIDYLVNEEFNKESGAWKHSPAVYWPVGSTMDMLAYSAQTAFADTDIDWGVPNCAERVRIVVGSDRTDDDILYGACWNEVSPDSEGTALSMRHSQALLEFSFSLKDGSSADCRVQSVTIKNIHLAGDLIIENNAGFPDHRWEFRRYSAGDCSLQDGGAVYDRMLAASPVSMRILVPEQEMSSLKVVYSVNGEKKESTKDLPHANWLAGRRYTYSFTISD